MVVNEFRPFKVNVKMVQLLNNFQKYAEFMHSKERGYSCVCNYL